MSKLVKQSPNTLMTHLPLMTSFSVLVVLAPWIYASPDLPMLARTSWCQDPVSPCTQHWLVDLELQPRSTICFPNKIGKLILIIWSPWLTPIPWQSWSTILPILVDQSLMKIISRISLQLLKNTACPSSLMKSMTILSLEDRTKFIHRSPAWASMSRFLVVVVWPRDFWYQDGV